MKGSKLDKQDVSQAIEPANRNVLLVLLALAIFTAIAYWPVTRHEFVSYDDPRYVTSNEIVQKGFGPDSISYAFQSDDGGNWHPLTWFSLMLDAELFGLDPSGYHVSNVVYHILTTLLLFIMLHSWTGALWRSAFVAGAFALHPLHVESVAWVAERKDTLSALMWVATCIVYGWYARRPRLDTYLLLLVVFALGLMSKPMLVTLPFVLLLLDFWPLDRVKLERGSTALRANLRLLWEKIPLFALVVLASYITIIMQRRSGAVMSTSMVNMGERASNALLSYMSYLGKMIWPTDLAVFYPYPSSFALVKVIGAIVFLLTVSVYSVLRLRRRPYLAVGWFWFLGTLVPVIGLVQVGAQAMADRYTYIPLIGIFVVVAWGVVDLLGNRVKNSQLVLSGSLILILCLVGTRMQLRHWANDEALYGHAIEVTTGNFMMHHNLGKILEGKGRTDEAIKNYRAAVEINGWRPSQLNLGVLLSGQGNESEAIKGYRRALRSRPNDASIHNNLANSLAATGAVDEAIVHFREAVRIRPSYFQAQSNFALALVRAGRPDEAITAARAALRVKPRFAQAHNALGIALAAKGHPREAIASYREAIRLLPGWPPAMRRLAWLFATYPDGAIRDGAEAVRLASKASARTGNKNARMLDTLAAAQAENGNFKGALIVAEQALAAARSAGDDSFADEIETRLALYRDGVPFRDTIGTG